MSTKIRRSLYQVTIKLMLVSQIAATLAGLIPPPAVSSVLPAAVAELAEALLPTASVAQAAPLAQAVSASGVLTITKSVIGTGAGPFNITVTGPGGYNNSTTVSPGTPLVLTGLAVGTYTVVESSPGVGWTTTYTATPGTGGSSKIFSAG